MVSTGRKVKHDLVGQDVRYKDKIWRVKAAFESPNGKPWLALSRPELIRNVLVKAKEVELVRN